MARYESEGTWFENRDYKIYPKYRNYVLDMVYRRPTKESIIARLENALKINSVRIDHAYGNVNYNDYIALRDVLSVVRDELKVLE